VIGLTATLLGVSFFLVLLLSGLWIPFAVATAGIVIMVIDGGLSALKALGFVTWSSMNSSTLSAIPLFILMADLLLRSGVSDRIYAGLFTLVRKLPGGLLQTNILGCALFAAISGSSVATAAAIGTVAIPQLKEKGYDPAMTAGSIAAGGTLGILIPPSIAMILYGTFTEVSIAKLFLAGLLPGIAVTLLFMTYIGLHALWRPHLAPKVLPETRSAFEFVASALQILPLLLLMGLVLGTIYLGIATPTEAAAVGTVGALLVCLLFGRLSLEIVVDAVRSTLRISGSILFIVVAAFVFAYGMEKGGVGGALTDWIVGMNLTPATFILILVVGYILMGCIIDSIGMIVLTVPVLVPVFTAMDIDLIWFGVLLVLVVEIGQITPPLGINLFVIESISRRGLGEVIRGTLPYHGLILVFVGILALFPELATWLPAQMTR